MGKQTFKTLSIVVAGWYFKNTDIYEKLIKEAESYKNFKAGYYIASHKKAEEIDREVREYLTKLGWKLLYFKNEGWDWGTYQQFLIWQKENENFTDFYLFLHDDIRIKRYGFIGEFLKKIKDGAKVVGNGLPYPYPLEREWKEMTPHIFFWAKFKGVFISQKKWKCVRGSCFFTIKKIAEDILIKMPIKNGFHSGFGNWSVKIFGGLLKDLYGENAIKYLGNEIQNSDYIEEEYRGGNQKNISFKSLIITKLKKIVEDHPLLKRGVKFIIKGQKAPEPPMGLKINLGCGKRYLEGYLNIDVEESKYVDLKANILSLDFEKESVSVVSLVYVIEHIDFLKVKPFLEKVYSWIKKDGQLILEFPDIIKVAKCVLKLRNNIEKLQEDSLGIRGFYGEPTMNMTIYDYHKWGWSENTIKSLLKEIGFRKIYIEKPQYHGKRVQRDSRVVAIK